MAETPEQIWINKVFGRHPGDWNFTDGQHLTRKQLREKVKYIREDVAEAEKQLAVIAAQEAERERCAKVAETHPMRFAGQTEDDVRAALAAAIRAQGEKT